MTILSFYSEDRREPPFEEMKQLVAGRRTIISMMGDYVPAEASAKAPESPRGGSEAGPGSFPEKFAYSCFVRTTKKP